MAQDLEAALDQTKMATVALGVCIARVLARTNPAIQQEFAAEADRMHKHLCENDRYRWGEVLVSFALALGHPEKFPLFHPPEK